MLAAGIAWVLYTPYNNDAVWRAIPENVAYFSRHEHAAERVAAYALNPLTMTIFRSIGMEPEVVRTAIEDPSTRLVIQRLLGRDIVLAYTPGSEPHAQPAWVFASWIGHRAKLLRWKLAWRTLPGMHTIRLPGQLPFWRLESAPISDGIYLSLGLTDGLLLGCLSTDPAAVRILVATWDQQPGYPSMQPTAWRKTAERLAAKQAPDWGAYALAESTGPDDVPTSLFPALYQLEPDFATGAIGGSFHISAATRADGIPPLDGLDTILGDAPVLWTLISPALSTSLTRQPNTPRWAVTLARALRPAPADHDTAPSADLTDITSVHYPLFFAVLNERFAGSIRGGIHRLAAASISGFKIPAVIAGLYVGTESRADEVFMSLLDQFNREYRLGLIPRRAPGSNITVIEDTRSDTTFYDRLLLQERVGSVYHQGWLLIAGQSSILSRLISESHAGPETGTVRRWMPTPERDASLLYGWADLAAFGTLANDALAAVALMLLLRDTEGSLETRRELAQAQAWIKGLSALEQGAVWLDLHDTRFDLRFDLGTPAKPIDP